MTTHTKWIPGCLAVVLVAAAASCSDDASSVNAPGASLDGGAPDASIARATQFSRPSRGSALDIAEDDTLLVAINRDVGTVSVFDISQAGSAAPTVTKRAEVPVCADPWQVALSPSGDRAFVVCRKDQKLVRVDALRSSPVKGLEVAVGSEPTSLALTPRATTVWVSNWMDGTMSEVDADAMTVRSTVDLNDALVKTGALGGVAARPALAHPRNVAVTNNKDENENDEFVYVAEFFAQQTEPLNPDGRNADTSPDIHGDPFKLLEMVIGARKELVFADCGCEVT